MDEQERESGEEMSEKLLMIRREKDSGESYWDRAIEQDLKELGWVRRSAIIDFIELHSKLGDAESVVTELLLTLKSLEKEKVVK